jgi:hypothetical protein
MRVTKTDKLILLKANFNLCEPQPSESPPLHTGGHRIDAGKPNRAPASAPLGIAMAAALSS